MEIKTGGNTERGKRSSQTRQNPRPKLNLPLREGHNKVSDKLKKKKVIFQLQDLSSTATGCPSNRKQVKRNLNNQTLAEPPKDSTKEKGEPSKTRKNSQGKRFVGVLYQTPEWSQEERIGNPQHTVGEIPDWPSHQRKTWIEEQPSRTQKIIPTRQATTLML